MVSRMVTTVGSSTHTRSVKRPTVIPGERRTVAKEVGESRKASPEALQGARNSLLPEGRYDAQARERSRRRLPSGHDGPTRGSPPRIEMFTLNAIRVDGSDGVRQASSRDQAGRRLVPSARSR